MQDLYALTRALTHLADRVAWLAILRAPWCGLTLDELCALFEPHPERTVWEGMQGVPRLARIVAVLGAALANRLRGTLRDRVEGTWLALGGPACVEDATGLEDAEAYLDELEKLEEAGDLSDFSSLAESLAKLFALPDVDAGPEAVEIMTIHKAKGLEFDTVIVPGLDRSPRSGRKPLFAWRALPGGQLLLAPIDETGGEREPLYTYVRSLDREAEDIEAGRLFYVAATRAESRLYLLGCVKVDEDGVVKMPLRRSLLGLAWPAVGDSVRLPAAVSVEEEKASLPAGELRRLPSDFEMPEVPMAVKWGVVDEGREDEQVEFSWVGETARHVGTVVHRWLQRMAEDELRGWDLKGVRSLENRIGAELARRGVRSSEIGSAVERSVSALEATLGDERGRWTVAAHPDARSEYRLRTWNGNEMRSYVVDRVFQAEDGARWIIDFKTSRHEGTDLSGFLDRERDRYANQMMAYRSAIPGSRLGLYFPIHHGWRQWDF